MNPPGVGRHGANRRRVGRRSGEANTVATRPRPPMHRIRPPVLEGAIVRNGQLETGPLISELGIYGLCVGAGQAGLHGVVPRTAG